MSTQHERMAARRARERAARMEGKPAPMTPDAMPLPVSDDIGACLQTAADDRKARRTKTKTRKG